MAFLLPTLLIGATLSFGLLADPEPEFSLSISSPPGTFKTGADVKLRIVLTNVTDHKISIWRMYHPTGLENEYSLDIRDSEGHSVPLTRYGRAVHGTPDVGDDRQDCGDCSRFSQDIDPNE